LAQGAVFHGRYEVVRCLAVGGMGAVYEVTDQKTRRRRALKVMLPNVVADRDLHARFRREATITSEIESAHIVETIDADVDAQTGVPFVVMELLKGEDLGKMLGKRRRLPPGEVILLLHQASLALDRTHAAGIVHRDLKPENLFVCASDDGSPWLKVLDFGIAKIVADSQGDQKTTRAMGTPVYMPPEQIQGDGRIGPRADLYALGHIAYTLLVGEAYWEQDARETGATYALCRRILVGPIEPSCPRAARAGVVLPPAFEVWFAKATALDPQARFDKASTLVAELAQAVGVPWPRLSVAPADPTQLCARVGVSLPPPVEAKSGEGRSSATTAVSWWTGAVGVVAVVVGVGVATLMALAKLKPLHASHALAAQAVVPTAVATFATPMIPAVQITPAPRTSEPLVAPATAAATATAVPRQAPKPPTAPPATPVKRANAVKQLPRAELDDPTDTR
jgi:serine/threonine-protein kinase